MILDTKPAETPEQQIERLERELRETERAAANLNAALEVAQLHLKEEQERKPSADRAHQIQHIQVILDDPKARQAYVRTWIRGVMEVVRFARLRTGGIGQATPEELAEAYAYFMADLSHEVYDRNKLISLPFGCELGFTPEGEPLLFDGGMVLECCADDPNAEEFAESIRNWLNSPEAHELGCAEDPRWAIAVEAERCFREESTEKLIRAEPRFQVAFRSREVPNGTWLVPGHGLTHREAKALLQRMRHAKPGWEHWLEPLRMRGERMRIELPDGMTLSVHGVTIPRRFVAELHN